MMNKQIVGVVLCGGQSSRMGTDKAMLQTNNQFWVERCIDLFSQLKIEVVLSVNTQQNALYHKIFSSVNVVQDSFSIIAKGPLLGILSVHETHGEKDLFVLACDLPFMNIKVLEKLFNYYTSDFDNEAYVFKNGEDYEPLCTIYTSQGLKRITNMIEQGLIRKHSMKHILETLNTISYPLSQEWKQYFLNINSQEELRHHFKR